jgi:MFS transporter, ACS family, hexuronate transporter
VAEQYAGTTIVAEAGAVQPAAAGERRTKYRWVIVGLLMVAAAINYIDRSCMGIAAPKIQEELSLTNTQIGIILGVFQWGYAAAYMLAGLMVDRLGARKGYPIIMALWSLADALTSVGTRLWHFIGLRILLGVGEAGCWPTNNKVVAEWFPRRERPLACGLFDGGAKVGMVIGPPAVAYLVLHWSWQVSFIATGCAALVWIPCWALLYRRPENHPWVNEAELAYIQNEAEGEGIKGRTSSRGRKLTWQRILRYPQVWGVLVLNASTATTWFVLSNWLPKYFYDVRGIEFNLLGWYAAMPMVGAVIGNIGGGWFLGWLISRPSMTVTKARRTMIFISVAMMTCLIPAAYASNVLVSAFLMAIVGIGYSSHATNILSSISDLVAKDLVATVTGIQATGAFLLTLPIVTYTGWIIEQFGYTALLAASALLPYLSLIASFTLIRRFGSIEIDQVE